MTQTVLVLGANGRFGRAATQAFATAGWQVRAATRSGEGKSTASIAHIACDVTDRAALIEAAKDADVIVHAVHPLYPQWAKVMPLHTANVIAAGLASGAVVMIPGNVYPFGPQAGEVFTEGQAKAPMTRKGALRVTMEGTFQAAAAQGLRTIILRGGDFLERTKTGGWFDSHLAHKVHQGKFTYPGPMNAVHAWAYLPDMARAMADLAARRDALPSFASFGFEGYSLTGAQLVAAVEMETGKAVRVAKFPWWVLRAIAPFNPLMREVLEMRYLWDTPHRLDPAPLRAVLPDFALTPLATVMADVLAR